MVKKSLTRSAINIVYGDQVYGIKPYENNMSENNHMSDLPPLTDECKMPQFSLVNQQIVYFFSKHLTFLYFLH